MSSCCSTIPKPFKTRRRGYTDLTPVTKFVRLCTLHFAMLERLGFCTEECSRWLSDSSPNGINGDLVKELNALLICDGKLLSVWDPNILGTSHSNLTFLRPSRREGSGKVAKAQTKVPIKSLWSKTSTFYEVKGYVNVDLRDEEGRVRRDKAGYRVYSCKYFWCFLNVAMYSYSKAITF